MSGAARAKPQGFADPQFAAHVIDGLGRPQKRLAPKYFYDDAGSRLFDRFPEFPAILIGPSGGLDDPSGLRPVAQFWTARKQDWVVLPQDQLVDARQPDGFAAVIALYQARQAAGAAGSEAASDAGGGPGS